MFGERNASDGRSVKSEGQLTRDQRRAQHAYHMIRDMCGDETSKVPDKYKIELNTFGANLLRSGLAVAVATLERDVAGDGSPAAEVLKHLAAASIPHLNVEAYQELGDTVRALDLDKYMLASREARRVTQWLRRAVQARD